MHEILEVEARDQDTGVAFTRRGMGDVPETPAKSKVTGLDGVHDRRGPHRAVGCVCKSSVTFQFGELEGGSERLDQCLQEVGQDVLGVLQLGCLEVSRVAGDVGEEETAGFCCREIRGHAGNLLVGYDRQTNGERRPAWSRVDGDLAPGSLDDGVDGV